MRNLTSLACTVLACAALLIGVSVASHGSHHTAAASVATPAEIEWP